MKSLLLLTLLAPTLSFATEIDETLNGYVKEFGLRPLSSPVKESAELVDLGHTLFETKLLSGNKNISCRDCHHPRIMTHDALPLSIGEGAQGIQTATTSRTQGTGTVLARNTPALFNLHGMNVMFWDGRVSFDPETGAFTTPVAELNGPTPVRSDITSKLGSAVAAQAIFPIADFAEMRGAPGTNKIADAATTLEAWDLVVEQLLLNERIRTQFEKVFPGEKIHIGHVGKALAAFQIQAFAYNDTPFDRYLKGDGTALTDEQKKGMDVFFGKGSCGNCHNGEHLTSFEFDNVAVPQIGPGKMNGDDLGRQLVDPEVGPYTFRVAPLRNVALTAPYMHSGVFASLDEVVEHYDDLQASLTGFTLDRKWDNYVLELRDHDHTTDLLKLGSIPEDLKPRLHFTVEEEGALIHFIKTALTDVRLIKFVQESKSE